MAWRARRHHLDKRVKAGGMLDVTRRLSGLQAQVMSSTELALWARVEDLPRDAVERALWQDRAMVKTWAMRGTLHLLAADDYWTYQPVLNEYRHYLAPGWLRAWEMSREDLDRLLAAVAVALDGAVLTRAELGAEVARRTKSAALGERVRGSWGMFLKPASYRGELCFGPGSGQNVAFTSPASWLGERPAVDPDQARLEVARRFLA
ncbi:MAG: hypothetical protein QOE92_142, partial [Chloroflexota bacterium]|nr:hypothetical protein [Chloroflexota bacterium]